MKPRWTCPECKLENSTVDGDSCKCGYIITKEEFLGA